MSFYNSGRNGVRQLLQRLKGCSTPSGVSSNSFEFQLLDSSSSQALSHLGASSSSSSSRCMCRAYSEFAAPARRAGGTGLRRVNPSGSAANGSSAAAEGAASTSGEAGGPLLAEMKEVPGGSKPLRKWEYYYWGLGATGIAFLLYNRMKDPEPTDEEKAEKERKLEELRARRKDHIRTVLMSQNFLLGDKGTEDPFEGLTPNQIVMFCEKYNIDPTDPLEGMTPEEIDAYMAQQAAKQEQEDEA